MEQLRDFAHLINDAVARLETAEQRVAHLEQVIRQAVMTHGGKLQIDSRYGEEAQASTATLWFGIGGVELVTPRAGEQNGVRLVTEPHWGKKGFELESVGWVNLVSLVEDTHSQQSTNLWHRPYAGTDTELFRKI